MLQPTTMQDQGPTFSRLVAGVMTWGQWGAKYSANEMADLLSALVDRGITTIDHADIYGHYTTEAEFGAALARVPHLKQKIQLISKCGIQLPTEGLPHPHKSYEYSPAYIRQQVDQSLANLGVEQLDLLLLHRPSPLLAPRLVAETLKALMAEGKVAQVGVSNFTPSQTAMLNAYVPLLTNQVEASLMHLAPFQDGTFDQALTMNYRPMAWSPLGGGQLFTQDTPEHWQPLKTAVQELAEEKNVGLDVIMLAWLLQHPSGILPVLGSTKLDRWEGYIKALDVTLTHYEWLRLWRESVGEELP